MAGAVLRVHAHARIRSIDVSKALKLPGCGPQCSRDLPLQPQVELGKRVNLRHLSNNILAADKCCTAGTPIAVAAVPCIAEEAVALIKVEYEVPPPVLEARAAMEPQAPLLHDDLFTDELGETARKASNIAKHFRFERRPGQGLAGRKWSSTRIQYGDRPPGDISRIMRRRWGNAD